MDNVRGFASPRADIWVGDGKIGVVQGFRVTETFAHAPLRGLGSLFTLNHEVTAITVAGSFDLMRILELPFANQGDKKLWYDQRPGNNPSGYSHIINYVSRSLKLVDRESGDYLLVVLGFKPASRDFSLSDGGLFMESGSFVATKLIDNRLPIITPDSPAWPA